MRPIKTLTRLLAPVLTVLALEAQAAEGLKVHMLLVTPDNETYASHINGAVLGQSEGNIQGRFLGIEYQLEEVSAASGAVAREGISAVIVAAPFDQLLQVYQTYAKSGVPVFNIALQSDGLRQICRPGLYHTPPSDRMLADAEEQWATVNSGAQATALAWHPEFVKFAGRDLNKRYTEQFGVPMDSAAWAGWAATRIVAEAVVRTSSNEGPVLDAYIREDLGFDGQKGLAQTFRNNGQLRQPLLLQDSDGQLLGEAPVRGAVADTNDLDSLGIPGCP